MSESGINSRFCSVLSDGGIRNSEHLRIGENSLFCSVLNVGGIRNSEPLRIGGNSRFRSVLNVGGIRNSESFYNAFTLNYKRRQDQILYVLEERGTVNKFTDVDGNGKFNILLRLVLTEDQFLSVQFAIFSRSDNFF